MDSVEADISIPSMRPRAFTLRLPPSAYSQLEGLAFETKISMNEVVTCAVEKFMRETQGDLKAVVETVAVQKAERFRQETLAAAGLDTRLTPSSDCPLPEASSFPRARERKEPT
jgi:hypothetical protein